MLAGPFRLVRSQALLVLVVVLGVAAGGAITLLQGRADASRKAQAQVGALKFSLVTLENAPISADQPALGLGQARARIQSESRSIYDGVRKLIADGSPPAPLLRVQAAVGEAAPVIQQIFTLGSDRGDPARIKRELPTILAAVSLLQVKATAAIGLLTQTGRIYSQRAANAKTQAVIGSLATILLLLCIFVLFYRRATIARAAAERLSIENTRLLEASRYEAVTDPLTGLGNRRAFSRDLERILGGVNPSHELLVAMFDLDGFKQYNDTFGHSAGDALLARLAGRAQDAVAGSATAYRMGGDEFCLLAQSSIEESERLLRVAVAALSDGGDGWSVGCSWGLAWVPSEASNGSAALRIADERMYTQKAGRATESLQAAAALAQVLAERDSDLSTHTSHVNELSTATARRLGLAELEVARIGLAAQLHDIGKTAIPESILAKPGPLNPDEWDFMRRHTLIGERIIAAAPSLAHTAALVRSSHERVDGSGYPDGLAGTDIPLGSKIIAVCDAFDAMIAPRPYRDPRTIAEAISELRRYVGSQFDPEVVEGFCAVALERETSFQPSELVNGLKR